MNELHSLGQEPGDNWAEPIAAFAVAGLFGVLYNQLVARLNRDGLTEGYSSWLVVIGSGALLIVAAPLLGMRRFLAILGIFAAGGTPMIIGDMTRYAGARRAVQDWIRVNGNGANGDGNKTEGMAGKRSGMADPWQRGVGPR